MVGGEQGHAKADIIFVYVTHPDSDAAASIGRTLVETGLAACINLLPGMQTIYRWEGRIETGVETVMVVKTRADLFGEVCRSIHATHPYICPCIVALPVSDGLPAYLDWIGRSCIAPANSSALQNRTA